MKQKIGAPQTGPKYRGSIKETRIILDEFFEGHLQDEHGHWKDLMFFLGLPQEMGHNSPGRREAFIRAMHSKKGLYNPFLGERITNTNLQETVQAIKRMYRKRRKELDRSPFANDLFPYYVNVMRMLVDAERDL